MQSGSNPQLQDRAKRPSTQPNSVRTVSLKHWFSRVGENSKIVSCQLVLPVEIPQSDWLQNSIFPVWTTILCGFAESPHSSPYVRLTCECIGFVHIAQIACYLRCVYALLWYSISVMLLSMGSICGHHFALPALVSVFAQVSTSSLCTFAGWEQSHDTFQPGKENRFGRWIQESIRHGFASRHRLCRIQVPQMMSSPLRLKQSDTPRLLLQNWGAPFFLLPTTSWIYPLLGVFAHFSCNELFVLHSQGQLGGEVKFEVMLVDEACKSSCRGLGSDVRLSDSRL